MLKCELCGGFIIKVLDNVFVCENCGCRYTKEQALKLLDKSGVGSSNGKSDVTQSNDFVIVGGELKEYKGSAVHVVVPDGVVEIGWKAFYNMTSILSVKLPDSTIRIKDSAFHYCKALREVSLGNGVQEIGREAFSGCKNLQSVTLPQSLSSIGALCFYECESLEELKLPDGLEEIDERAFGKCTSLTELVIPNSVKKIGRIERDLDALDGVRYDSIFSWEPLDIIVKMPNRFDALFVKGCKCLFDLSGKRMETAEEAKEARENLRKQIRDYRLREHVCLACGGDIGIFSGRCKKCNKPFGEE